MGRKKNQCSHEKVHLESVYFVDGSRHVQVKCDFCPAVLRYEPSGLYDMAELPEGETRKSQRGKNQ